MNSSSVFNLGRAFDVFIFYFDREKLNEKSNTGLSQYIFNWASQSECGLVFILDTTCILFMSQAY